MGLTYTSTLPAPAEEVFAWHARPGALTRLLPPWWPARVVSEATSLRDGQAVLRLPTGLQLTATHQPDGYDPPRRFTDQLASPLLRGRLPWRHTHEFTPAGDKTELTDILDTPVPAAALRAAFAYRHDQLAADLASQAEAHAWRPEPLTVAVTGSGGLVGSAVTALLSTGGHRVIRLVRRPAHGRDERQWDPADPAADLLAGTDAVIHLAGASIAGRFTEAHKTAIWETRVGPTRRLAERAAATPDGPDVFVSASAIGYYGADRGEETLTEASPRGSGFLADLVNRWEDATSPAADAGLRCVRVRTGIVQSPRGGVLRLQLPLFAAGLGGRLGDGRQWLSWIGIDDLAGIYLRAVCDPGLSGPVNATAPHPVRNAGYTRTLAAVLRRPALLPVPAALPRLLLSPQGAAEFALASQHVQPHRLQQAGHHFRHPWLGTALGHLLGRPGIAEPA